MQSKDHLYCLSDTNRFYMPWYACDQVSRFYKQGATVAIKSNCVELNPPKHWWLLENHLHFYGHKPVANVLLYVNASDALFEWLEW